MPSKFGGRAVEESKSKFGGIPISDPEMNPGHAPTLGDQAMDSLKFAGNEALGAGKAVIAPITAIADRVAHPPDYTNTPMVNPTEVGQAPIVKMASDINNQMDTGDMSGLAQNLGGIGAQAAMLKAAPVVADSDVSGAISSAAGKLSTVGKGAVQGTVDASRNYPAHATTGLLSMVPGVGHVAASAIESGNYLYNITRGIRNALADSKAVTTTASPELLDGVSQWALNKKYVNASASEKLQIQRLAEKIKPSK